MNEQLQKKIDQAIAFLRAVAPKDGSPIEVAYSGGKDSDVILQLAKEAGINYRAIYKNTTIDPPYTHKHCREMGVEFIQPKITFFQIIAKTGFPQSNRRICCKHLKEYKVLDKAIIGVRRDESNDRKERYTEPTQCRIWRKGRGKNQKGRVTSEQFLPLLNWTAQDVVDFIEDRGIRLHPLYYREDGTIDETQRLGCLCCPLKYYKKRIADFKRYPNMVKLHIKYAQQFLDTHPNSKPAKSYKDVYEWFFREVFFDRQAKWTAFKKGYFADYIEPKQFLERFFKIEL